MSLRDDIARRLAHIGDRPAFNSFHGATHVTNARMRKRLAEATELLDRAEAIVADLPDVPEPPKPEPKRGPKDKASKTPAKKAKKE